MKRILFFSSTLSFALIFFLAVSCTKNSSSPCRNCGGGNNGGYTSHYDTLNFTASQWTKSGDGIYTSSFIILQLFDPATEQSSGSIREVYLNTKEGKQLLSATPADYLGGKLWFTMQYLSSNSRPPELVLSYSNEFGEQPGELQSTHITVVISK